MTLTDFLLARIAERERLAHEYQRNGWQLPDEFDWPTMLAECEAKRRIVGMGPTRCPFDPLDEPDHPHYPDDGWADVPHWYACSTCADSAGADAVWRAVLRDLALPYADHPDYREEWRP